MWSFSVLRQGMGKSRKVAFIRRAGNGWEWKGSPAMAVGCLWFCFRSELTALGAHGTPIGISCPACFRKTFAFSLSENPFRMKFKVIALKMWANRSSAWCDMKEKEWLHCCCYSKLHGSPCRYALQPWWVVYITQWRKGGYWLHGANDLDEVDITKHIWQREPKCRPWEWPITHIYVGSML